MSITLDVSGAFPDGTELGAYEGRTQVSPPAAPLGDPVDTATVSAGSVTFDNLAEDELYIAIGQVSGEWIQRGFVVNQLPAVPVLGGIEIATQAGLDAETATRAAADSTHTSELALLRAAPINVKDSPYSAVGNGTADDTAALQAAITAAATGGRRVFIPAGTYKLTAPLTVPNFVRIEGAGESTILRCAGDFYAISFAPGNRSSVQWLQIDAAAVQSAGGGFDYSGAGSNIFLDSIYFGSNLHTSVNLAPTSSGAVYEIARCRWNGVTGCAYGIIIGGGGALVTDVYISNTVGTASTTADMTAWLAIPATADTIKVSESLFIKGGTGIAAGSASQVTNLKFSNVTVDTMTGNGVYLEYVRECELSGVEISTCGAANVAGLSVGANAKGARLIGGVIQNCAGYGATLASGSTDVRLLGVTVSDNNTSDTAFNDGIAALGSHFQIIGCSSGNNLLMATGHQKYGISVAAASDHFAVVANDLRGNETDPISVAATGTDNAVWGNLPLIVPTVASASAITLPAGRDFIVVSGTTTITSIAAAPPGRRVTLRFSGALTVTDGSNLKLAGDFTTSAGGLDTLSLACDGTSWLEVARSAN